MKFYPIFASYTLEKPKQALSQFLSVGNAHDRVFVNFSRENGRTVFDETLHKAGSYFL